jgi:hypothetical protein
MRMRIRDIGIALAGATALALAATSPAASAPVASNTALLKASAPDATIEVRHRGYRHGYRRHWAGPAVAGLALGIIGSAAFAATAPRYYYYDDPYYYAPRAYYADPYPYSYSYGYGPYWGGYSRERFW